jgi:hypothetical protein
MDAEHLGKLILYNSFHAHGIHGRPGWGIVCDGLSYTIACMFSLYRGLAKSTKRMYFALECVVSKTLKKVELTATFLSKISECKSPRLSSEEIDALGNRAIRAFLMEYIDVNATVEAVVSELVCAMPPSLLNSKLESR